VAGKHDGEKQLRCADVAMQKDLKSMTRMSSKKPTMTKHVEEVGASQKKGLS